MEQQKSRKILEDMLKEMVGPSNVQLTIKWTNFSRSSTFRSVEGLVDARLSKSEYEQVWQNGWTSQGPTVLRKEWPVLENTPNGPVATYWYAVELAAHGLIKAAGAKVISKGMLNKMRVLVQQFPVAEMVVKHVGQPSTPKPAPQPKPVRKWSPSRTRQDAFAGMLQEMIGQDIQVVLTNLKSNTLDNSFGSLRFKLGYNTLDLVWTNGYQERYKAARRYSMFSHPKNGFEGLYLYAMSMAARFRDMGKGYRWSANGTVKELVLLSQKFSLEYMTEKYGIDDVLPEPEQIEVKRFTRTEVQAYRKYMVAIVDFLSDVYGVADKMEPTVFRNRKGSFHRKMFNGMHQIVFGYESVERSFKTGFNEYKTVQPFVPEAQGTKGLKGMWFLAMHEFAHVLQTEEPNNGMSVSYTYTGQRRRQVHGPVFVAKYREILDEGLAFEDSLELVDAETRNVLLAM